MNINVAEIDSPVGCLTVAAQGSALIALYFENLSDKRIKAIEKRFGNGSLVAAKDPAGIRRQLRAYFAGDIDALRNVEVKTWGTPFQQSVWAELRRIPAGETRSYGELATAIGSPKAVRAVGAANGANPVGIVVPCHRVIGANGKLTGFAGGLEAKRWLLEHENGCQGLFAGSCVKPAA